MNFFTDIFLPTVVNMTITASLLIVLVLAARLALRRAPKIFSYALWSVVLFRLLCPVSFTSDFALLGLASPPVTATTAHTAAVSYVRPAGEVVGVDQPARPLPVQTQTVAVAPPVSTAPPTDRSATPFPVVGTVYLAGVCALLLYSVVSLLRLRRRLVGAVELERGVWLADHISSPFVLGLLRPKIYLPSNLPQGERDYIIAHERHHVRRLDHLVKLLAFTALCLHWFNPLVWLAFFLAVRDMEMSCDEAVMARMGRDVRADYSASLLSLATGRHRFAHSPLAFGEGDPKERVKNVLRWKKPRAWVALTAATACVLLIAACATNPKGESEAVKPAPGASETDSQVISQVANGLFVGKLSWDESYQGPASYTITAREQASGRTDTYVCQTRTYHSLESTPGRFLLDSYAWTPAETNWDPKAQLFPDFAGDYALRFETGDAGLLVSSDSDLLLLWQDGKSYAFTATHRNEFGDATPYPFFQNRTHEALYDYELQGATSVEVGERDYQAVAQELGKQYAAALANRPGWSPQQLEDCVFQSAHVFDAYYGEDDPNFCFNQDLYLKLTDDQVDWWQAGAGVEPVTEGPYAGWYSYCREAEACLGEDGNWHLWGLNTGGTSARLPADPETASAQELAQLYFDTAGQSHDYLIPYYFSQLSLSEVQDALAALPQQHCEALTDGIVSFSHDYPDDCSWSRSDLTRHSEHAVQVAPIHLVPHHSEDHH